MIMVQWMDEIRVRCSKEKCVVLVHSELVAIHKFKVGLIEKHLLNDHDVITKRLELMYCVKINQQKQ